MVTQVKGFSLSAQQKHLWELQHADQSKTYRARCAIEIEGCLDKALLKVALEKTVQRHEILRTTIHDSAEADSPLQVITDDAELSHCEIDLS